MSKISQYPAAGPLSGTERVLLNQDGVTKTAAASSLIGGGTSGVQVFNVRDYGAVGDGAADDTAAIQAAVTATLAGTRRGGIVYAPLGTYRITSTITLPDPDSGFQDAISLWGAGPTLTTFNWTGASSGYVPMFDVLGQAYCSYRGFGMTNGTGAGRAETVGFWFRGDAHAGGTTGGSAIFEHVAASGFSRGMIIGDVQDGISEVLFILCGYSNCDYGVLASNANTLDLTWILPTFGSNTVGIDMGVAGCGQVYGGSASYNTTDFRYSTGGTFTVSGVRSESAGMVLDLITGTGIVEGCSLYAPASSDKIQLRSAAGNLVVTGSWVEGKIATRGGNGIVLTGNWIGNGGGTSSTPLVILIPNVAANLGGCTLVASANQGVPGINFEGLFANRSSVFDTDNVEHGWIQDSTTGLITFP